MMSDFKKKCTVQSVLFQFVNIICSYVFIIDILVSSVYLQIFKKKWWYINILQAAFLCFLTQLHVCKSNTHRATLVFMWSCVSGHLTHSDVDIWLFSCLMLQLVGVCLLFGAGQVACSRFLELFLLRTASFRGKTITLWAGKKIKTVS